MCESVEKIQSTSARVYQSLHHRVQFFFFLMLENTPKPRLSGILALLLLLWLWLRLLQSFDVSITIMLFIHTNCLSVQGYLVKSLATICEINEYKYDWYAENSIQFCVALVTQFGIDACTCLSISHYICTTTTTLHLLFNAIYQFSNFC